MTEQQEFLEYVRKRTDKYNNPTNTDEITEELRECKTLGEVKNLTERVFPEWFVTTISKFSVDYPQFQQNWEMVCKKIGVKTLVNYGCSSNSSFTCFIILFKNFSI